MVVGSTAGSTRRHSFDLSEKRIFVKSDSGTRFVRLGPKSQLAAFGLGAVTVVWCIVATSFLVLDIVAGDTVRDAALRDQDLYASRIETLASDRDAQMAAAREAQTYFSRALEDVSRMQERVFEAELRVEELTRSTEALRGILRKTLVERDGAMADMASLQLAEGGAAGGAGAGREAVATMAFLSGALDQTSAHRDQLRGDLDTAEVEIAALEHEARLREEATDRIFSQLEEAVTVSMEPLDEMFRKVGHPPERLIEQMRRRHAGAGGPLTPIAMSTMGTPDPEAVRANAILSHLDQMNLYRLAADKLPLWQPVAGSIRRTSGFGYRRDPINGGRRLHAGTDWAGAYGTPIIASADGVVVHAGWQSGYGRLVKIQHEFGIETRFAHLFEDQR